MELILGGNYISVRKTYHVIVKILGELTWFNSAFPSISKKKNIVRWSQFIKIAVWSTHCFSNIVMYKIK